MEIGKNCPFRVSQLMQGQCETNCQLFVPDKQPLEGRCALSFLSFLPEALSPLSAISPGLIGLNQTIIALGRTISAK